MKIAQQIATEAETIGAGEAMEIAIEKAIATDQNWILELTRYTFDDNSVLAFRGADTFGFDADDAESIKAYAAWLADDADEPNEESEIARLLEAVEE